MNFNLVRFDSIDSTNTEALKHARQGADEGLCVIARQQTAGRGRQGRVWASPANAGLYLSIVLRPNLEAKSLPFITLAAAVAVFDTLTDLGLRADIKWPNDILVNEKKICGILAETTDTNEGLAVVVGIGINLTSNNFPDALADTATSIETEMGKQDPSEIEVSLFRHIEQCYELLNAITGTTDILDRWRERSSYFSGKPVRVTLLDEVFTGVTDGLEANGAFRVRRENGSVSVIQAGDVERLRPA
jgi:BirA family biotin operon repressor/biotin-[acetyl-CoA-carboxylase] ligase